MKSILQNKISCLHLCILGLMLLMAGCAGQNSRTAVQFSDDGTMVESRTGLMWQMVHSKQRFVTGAEADDYASQLVLAGFDDWRLPTSQELWDLYFTNDYLMGGELAKQVRMYRNFWTKDGDTILAGYLDEGDETGINRYFLDTNNGFVRAVRSVK